MKDLMVNGFYSPLEALAENVKINADIKLEGEYAQRTIQTVVWGIVIIALGAIGGSTYVKVHK